MELAVRERWGQKQKGARASWAKMRKELVKVPSRGFICLLCSPQKGRGSGEETCKVVIIVWISDAHGLDQVVRHGWALGMPKRKTTKLWIDRTVCVCV